MITFATISGDPVSFASLVDGVLQTIRITNVDSVSKVVKVFVAGNDGAAPEDCTDSNGKEISIEGWISARDTGTESWVSIHEPSSFPDSFDDLSDGCIVRTLAAGAFIDIDILLSVPASFDTSGLAQFSLVALSGEA